MTWLQCLEHLIWELQKFSFVRIAVLPLLVYSQCMSEQGVPRFWVSMTQHAPLIFSSLKELNFFSANTGHDKHLPFHNIIVLKSCDSGFVISPPVWACLKLFQLANTQIACMF